MIFLNTLEKLTASYPQLTYLHIEMPQKLAGFIHNNTIFINKDNSYRKQLETVAEEIGHYETSAGDIVATENKLEQAKQERKARDWGYQKLVSLSGLIVCYRQGFETLHEVADFFDISEQYLLESLDMYRRKLGLHFKFIGYEFDLTNGLIIKELE